MERIREKREENEYKSNKNAFRVESYDYAVYTSYYLSYSSTAALQKGDT